MTSEGLYYFFGFMVSIPDLDGSVSWTWNDEDLVEYFFIKKALHFPFVDTNIIIESFDFVLLVLGQFLLSEIVYFFVKLFGSELYNTAIIESTGEGL